jgi:type II secretion system protein G
MNTAPHWKVSLVRMILSVMAICSMATFESAEAQMPDADAAILRAKESGSSMDFRGVEEALGKLGQDKEHTQREETNHIHDAEASRSFLNELAEAKQQGVNERFVVSILELAKKYPTVLADPLIKNLADAATTEAQNFFRASNEEQRKERAQSDLRTIAGQLRTYQSDNGSLPTREQGIEALVTKPTGDPEPRNWRQLLQRVPLDPWGELYIYRPQGDGFAITSKGPDRQEGNVDDVTLASSASENK